MDMGKPPRQAAIDGSEEIWSAILASTLTHVAVFVPLFFLAGVSSVLFRPALGGRDLLAADVAVRGGDDRAGAVRAGAEAAACRSTSARASLGRLFTWSERVLDGMDDGYR